MKIRSDVYRNIPYTLSLADGKDWGEMRNHFYTDSCFGCQHDLTLDRTIELFQQEVDDFLSRIPSTEEEWLDMFSDCVIQDGYEDWHIDPILAMHLLKLYAKVNG